MRRGGAPIQTQRIMREGGGLEVLMVDGGVEGALEVFGGGREGGDGGS